MIDMNNFKEWVSLLKKNGLLCDMYSEKVDNAKSKLELVRCCLDANGVNFLQEMQSEGFALPYEIINKLFRAYINGRYIAEYNNGKGNGYTSCIYCCFDESDIEIKTTLTTVLGCTCDVWVGKNDFVKIYADKNCKLMIHCNETSRCIVEYWDGAIVEVDAPLGGKVELIKH